MADSPVTLLVITSTYPYGFGEEFLAAEAASWPTDALDIRVLPISSAGVARELPAGVAVDNRLADYRTRWRKASAALVASVHPLLWVELAGLAGRRRLTLRRVRTAVAVVGQTLLIRRGLRTLLRESTDDVVVYAYWHSPGAYAAALLKRRGRIRAVLARGHGSDIYEAIAPAGFLPLKRQLLADIDHTWTVSDDGARELVETFGADPGRVSVARLGVGLPRQVGPSPSDECFRVLSMSSCTPLKQVPLIARAIGQLAAAHPQTRVEWVHLGGGPGLASLRHQAAELEAGLTHLTCWLPGHLPHADILALLGERAFDVIVNASTTEGVPVSIMEAMARGIPAIAPNVGGVSELVGPESGWLLSSEVSEGEVVAALESALAERGSVRRRRRARTRVESSFDAAANHRLFADDMLRRSSHPSE